MFNQLVKAIPAASRISLADRRAVLRWCQELACTERQLRAAVYVVGSQPAHVRNYLHRPSVGAVRNTLQPGGVTVWQGSGACLLPTQAA